jgi:hypothetical protein
MTAAFAASLGMAVPYGAIFDQPEPGSPAANAHIEQGDVLTAIKRPRQPPRAYAERPGRQPHDRARRPLRPGATAQQLA